MDGLPAMQAVLNRFSVRCTGIGGFAGSAVGGVRLGRVVGSRSGCAFASRVAASSSRAAHQRFCRLAVSGRVRRLETRRCTRLRCIGVGRRLVEPRVATGTVRCARGAACLRAEWSTGSSSAD